MIKEALERLRISFMAYEKHRARNVYNSAYSNSGIVGLGSVGNAANLALQKRFQTCGYDINIEIFYNQMLLLYAFQQIRILDMSAIEEVCEKMQTECYNGLIVIKSTLQPGTMESLRKNCPDLRLSYNLEKGCN